LTLIFRIDSKSITMFFKKPDIGKNTMWSVSENKGYKIYLDTIVRRAIESSG
jgi:hypothetical protein